MTDGNSAKPLNGAQAEYIKYLMLRYNIAKIPDELTDEQVRLSRYYDYGFSASDSAKGKSRCC